MKTGFRGTFVISWAQTELDGQAASPLAAMQVGAVWSWQGEAMRVDGPRGVLPLGEAVGIGELRRRAALTVRRLLRAVEADTSRMDEPEIDTPLFENGFQVTDGRDLWNVTLIEAGTARHPLCLFVGEIPPRRTDLWVVSHAIDLASESRAEAPPAGQVCFTPGTLIATDRGEMPVEQVTLGTRLQTRDNGLQEVLWTGARRITGARLHAMPDLAPVRLTGLPGLTAPLVVSPDHRVLLRGAGARALFNTGEVLASASDLLGGRIACRDRTRREVSYHHLMLGAHEIIFANGAETESFHPGNGALAGLDPADRAALLASFPDLAEDPMHYGGHARRMLEPSEVALLRHEAA